ALARDAGLDEGVSRALTHLAWAALRRRDYALACEQLELALRHASDHGYELWRGYVLGYRAQVELDLGRWQDAVATAVVVLQEPRRSRMPRIHALTVLARVRARRGDPGVRPALEEALEVAERGQELQADAPVAAARAEAFWLNGDRDGVEQATADALALARLRHSPWFAAELLAWRRRAGIADRFTGDEVIGPHAVELAGDWSAAAAQWRRLGCAYEAALALAEADDEDALRRALDELRALGAKPAAAIVAR